MRYVIVVVDGKPLPLKHRGDKLRAFNRTTKDGKEMLVVMAGKETLAVFLKWDYWHYEIIDAVV